MQDSRLRIGTSGWRYPDWKPRFYPPDCPQRLWFDWYARQFSSVELNATFYRRFPDPQFRKWRAQAPPGFIYALKVPRAVSHRNDLAGGRQRLKAFCEQAQGLEEHLGPLLLQIGPHTHCDPAALGELLDEVPGGVQVAVEWRDDSWDTPETRQVLADIPAAPVEVDAPVRRFTGHPEVRPPAPAYLRLHGSDHWYQGSYGEDDLKCIAHWAMRCLQQQASQVYIYFNNTESGNAPANALQLVNICSEIA